MGKSAQQSPPKWGMFIDQDVCIGCQACVTACSMENNVPFVGEVDAGYGRSMQWIRIERYWKGDYPDVKATAFQPMLCQQCGHAPCEPVCPVYAAVHSEGQQTNLQVYNRCVGTRYCANNCPYQVRVFNWRDYQKTGTFNNYLNPEVTVRRRGVTEKCTFCLQRIVRGEDNAKAEGRQPADGEIVPACAQVCPTEAIIFGRLDDPASRVSQLVREGKGVQLLEELGTLPRITYRQKG